MSGSIAARGASSSAEKARLFSGTAAEFYRVNLAD
jgi:hypothetical protein